MTFVSASKAMNVHTSPALCANESPNLVDLDLLAGKATHFVVHDFLAGFANPTAKAHNCVLVDAGDAFNRADAAAFA